MPINSMSISQQDTISRNDGSFDYSNSVSTSLKRRTMTNNTFFNNRSSTERLSPNSKMVYSSSTNGLNNSSINSTRMIRHNTDDSLDILSSTRQTKPIFDIITDPKFDNNDSIDDDQEQQYDRKSQISDSMYDDQQLTSSPDKNQKPTLSTKLLRPFYNIRLRKKTNVS
jgi:hypothetical protein